MPNLSTEFPPQNTSETESEQKRPRIILGIGIGVGALLIMLLFAALVGSLLYNWLLRVPQATLLPEIEWQNPLHPTQAPANGVIPGEEPSQVPEEGILHPTPTIQVDRGITPPIGATSDPYELIVIVRSINVRTGPSTNYPTIITYPEGTKLQAIGRNEDASWFVITISPAQQGWVSVPLVRYEFDRYTLPVFPAPPLPINTPTPYGSAILVPPELVGSQPLAPILPARRWISLIITFSLLSMVVILERLRLRHLASTSLRQVLLLGAQLISH